MQKQIVKSYFPPKVCLPINYILLPSNRTLDEGELSNLCLPKTLVVNLTGLISSPNLENVKKVNEKVEAKVDKHNLRCQGYLLIPWGGTFSHSAALSNMQWVKY